LLNKRLYYCSVFVLSAGVRITSGRFQRIGGSVSCNTLRTQKSQR